VSDNLGGWDALEQMRVSLKSRLEELDTLLNVSRGLHPVDPRVSFRYLLKALLSYGADAASLVSIKHPSSNLEEDYFVFHSGESAEPYAYLDKILIDPLREEKVLIIPSKARIKRMGLPKGAPLPSALAAIAIHNGKDLTGCLWVVYEQPHRFLEPEVRFLNTLAGQAVMAVNNSSLYLKAEVGKRRLESVLSSPPEPVLVVNDNGRLMIANQAAKQMEEMIQMNDTAEDADGEIISEGLKQFLTSAGTKENKVDELN
jgi:transcriptional regulator with GAF, ATPase, and Fis domain